MAQYLLVSVLVHTPPSSSDLTANDTVTVYWDDSTSALVVKKNGTVWAGSAGGYFGILNDNYYVSGITSYEGEYAISGYSFCSGADLKWFKMLTSYASYPYMESQTTVDSPVCDTGGSGPVCDIRFTGAPTITHATDQSSGSFTVTATSSNGTVKYSLRDSDYSNMTNTTGTFSGLAPGNWTVYAKDANDCTASKLVKILYKPLITHEHYRFTWTSKKIGQAATRDCRVRIYERDYPGDVVEVAYGSSAPFELIKHKQGQVNDKFYPVHPTGGTLSLIAQKDYQYLPLFTQDDKRYRVVYEVDEGSGFTEIWQGYNTPSIYNENFEATPYAVEMRLVDGVKTLETEPFTDDSGNALHGDMKLIKIIALIMKKTGLNLKIRSGINIFEINHNTAATDDPLDQTYADLACYRRDDEPFKCSEVLESILKPFGARLIQDNNQWLLEEIDRATASYAYRVFTSDGVYESNSTFNPIIDVKASEETDRVAFTGGDHSMGVIPAYGRITVTNELNYVGSLIAGGFEKSDLLSPESEEVDSYAPGIFTSEEGFRDWTLRMPSGVSGVSGGRAVVLTDDNSLAVKNPANAERAIKDDIARSVFAFYFLPGAWSGNLRNAYIESAAKPYQYGPGDEIKLSFDYSTPYNTEGIEFIILRFAIKVGSNWLQQDLTWDTTEHIYRAYPKPSTSLQTFEMFVPLPEVSTVTDTTVRVRIYYYSALFYDYGLPSSTDDPADGTDGVTALKALSTTGIDYDYRLDARDHFTLSTPTTYIRGYLELRMSDAAEDLGIIRPNDFNATTNPKVWYLLSQTIENNLTLGEDRASVRDTLFYVDNVRLDALVNGQDAPRSETRSLTISKYLAENLEVELYNADKPAITNAKNMYNNYFRLSDGTPTTYWARSGVTEYLPLRDILLKVLGGNHSAPTFRMTGSFINEFSRIRFANYLRLTKPGSTMTLSNTTFTSDLSGWTQSGTGEVFAWVSDNSGSAEVTLNGAVDSEKLYQTITHTGGYIQMSGSLAISAVSIGNTLEHILWAVFYKGSSIVHAEKIATYPLFTSTAALTISHTAFCPSDITAVGFFFQYVSGSGEVTYQVSEFDAEGIDIQEVYQITDYQSDEFSNVYFFELMQLSKTYIALTGIDTGGSNQGGGTNFGDYNADFSTDYDGGI